MAEVPPPGIRIQHPPARPLLLYDGTCGFCKMWVRRWVEQSAGTADFLPAQDAHVAEAYPEILPDWARRGVVLLATDGNVHFAAHAVFRLFAGMPGSRGLLLKSYRHLPGFAFASETLYRLTASHRHAASALVRVLWLGEVGKPAHAITRWLFLRLLAAVYFMAFASLAVQISGLCGPGGILPMKDVVAAVGTGYSLDHYGLLPGTFWSAASATTLTGLCWTGALLAVLLAIGVAQVPLLILLWALYFTLCAAGQDFLQFQWDLLLLETGILAIFLAPMTLKPRFPASEGEPSRIAIWLLRWLTFRLMFQSGIVKLLSGDPTWRDLTALTFHYETQPLPTIFGWIAHQAPLLVQKTSTLVMYGIELGLAFLIFLPRGMRIIAALGFMLLQLGIAITGNYGFFNVLTVALCIPLLDDLAFPARVRRLENQDETAGVVTTRNWPRWILIPAAVLIILLTSIMFTARFGYARRLPQSVLSFAGSFQSLRSFNSYGLFAVMTTTRPEILVEGSNDGKTWRSYRFRYKPVDLAHHPRWCAPHMPRLDWQMWFAALGSARGNTWFLRFCQRLLEGSPEVLPLLQDNPFPDSPPIYVRATLYQYHFTNIEEWRESGNWWKREEDRLYCPVLQLVEGKLAVARM